MRAEAGSRVSSHNYNLSIVECRALIGEMSASLTDPEIAELREWSHRIGEAFYSHWLRKRSRKLTADSQNSSLRV